MSAGAGADGAASDGDRPDADGGSARRDASVADGVATRRDAVEAALGHRFRTGALVDLALRHRSARGLGRPSNERLEFLGDAVLGLVVGEALYRAAPSAEEGALTRRRSEVVSEPALARTMNRLGLAGSVEAGRSLARAGDALPRAVIADAFEALLGAVYLDGGLRAAREVCLRALEPELAPPAGATCERSWKSILQELTQRLARETPDYAVLRAEGPDHRRTFVCEARFRGKALGRGEGHSKKAAEQAAARAALKRHLGPGLAAAQAGETLPPLVVPLPGL